MPPAPPDFELARFLPYRLTVLAARLSADLAAQYRDRFGISVAEWRVLLHVADADTPSIRDIEAQVNLEKSRVSRAATRLAQKGYLTKHPAPDDRRLLHLSLTKKGRELLAELIPLAQAYQSQLIAALGPQADALDAALDTLLDTSPPAD